MFSPSGQYSSAASCCCCCCAGRETRHRRPTGLAGWRAGAGTVARVPSCVLSAESPRRKCSCWTVAIAVVVSSRTRHRRVRAPVVLPLAGRYSVATPPLRFARRPMPMPMMHRCTASTAIYFAGRNAFSDGGAAI